MITIILLFSVSNSNTQATLELNQPEGVQVIWIADSLIYADSFPVILGSFKPIFANITFETSYTKYNTSRNLYTGPSIFWIDLPANYSGSDELKIFAEGEFLGSYSFDWEKTTPFVSDPSYVIFTSGWSSYWFGEGQLNGHYDNNDHFNIVNRARPSDVGEAYAKPYNNDFNISGEFEFTSLLAKLNLENAHKFQSWRTSGLVYVTDQMGLTQKITLGFDEKEVSVEIYTNGGAQRSVYSEPIIGDLIDVLNSTTNEIINEVGTESQSLQQVTSSTEVSILNFKSYLLPFIALIIVKKKLSIAT